MENYKTRHGAIRREHYHEICFQSPPGSACEGSAAPWDVETAEEIAANRRGRAYRLSLPAGAEIALPANGSVVLLVPLGSAGLQIDGEMWRTSIGDFRLFEADRPSVMGNTGSTSATLVLFDAC